jgi:hypothetical protein
LAQLYLPPRMRGESWEPTCVGASPQAKNVGKKRSALTFVGALILIGTLSENDHSDTSSAATSTPPTHDGLPCAA